MIDVNDKIKGGAAIDVAIKKVAGAYAKAHDLVQEIAVAIVSHASMHKDCTRALTLVRAVPVQQARSLITYFMTVSPIGVLLSENAKDDKVRFLEKESARYNDFDLDKAKELKWWTLDTIQAEREATQVFAGGLFDDIVRQLERAIKNENKVRHYTEDAVQAAMQLKGVVEGYRAKFLAAKGASDKANDEPETKPEAGEPEAKKAKAA
jgi:hypothetical protein